MALKNLEEQYERRCECAQPSDSATRINASDRAGAFIVLRHVVVATADFDETRFLSAVELHGQVRAATAPVGAEATRVLVFDASVQNLRSTLPRAVGGEYEECTLAALR